MTNVDLFEHTHRFKLEIVIAEHCRRMKGTDHETYDTIEKDEVELSRLVVESLLSETFQEKIAIRFGHCPDFENLPGSCLLMMALATCNASVFHDVAGAKKKLEAMELSSYPGENVTDFTSDAQRLIKIMQGAYSLPIDTGSRLIMKLTATSSEFFYRKMWALLDTVSTKEMEYDLADPRMFTEDAEYSTLGPLGIVATMQATHGALLSQHRWPALTGQLPQSNNSSTNSSGPIAPAGRGTASASAVVLNRRRGFRCQGEHLVRDCHLPAPAGGTSGTPDGASSTRGRTPLAAWKYFCPPDLTVSRVDAQGQHWKFYTKCKCRATNTVGIYQLSHFDSEHIDNYRRPAIAPTTSAPPSSAPTSSDHSSPPIAPQSNLTSVTNPNRIPPGPPDISIRGPELDHKFDEIEFTGMWCTSVEADFIADATVTCYVPEVLILAVPPSLSSIFERERPYVTTVQSGDDDDDDDDTSTDNTFTDDTTVPDDDDDTSHVTFYGDLDNDDDHMVDHDYPTDDDGSDADTVAITFSDAWTSPGLSPAVRFDLQHPPPDDIYYDAIEELPLIVLHHDHEFFDCALDPPIFPLSWHRPRPLHWLHQMFLLWSFWISALLWDTILYFISPDPGHSVCRRIRCQRRPRTLAGFPITWIILSNCVMLSLSSFQGHPPQYPIPTVTTSVRHLHACSTTTFQRITALDNLVVLNIDTLLQFQSLKARTALQTLQARKPTPLVTEPIMTKGELDTFFDSYDEFPCEGGENFFDATLWTLDTNGSLDWL
jgi:hypothetical protein